MPTRVILGAVLGVLLGCVGGSAQVTLELAQSHVFPAPARTWETAGLSRYGDIDLHLVGNREALTIFELGSLAESSAVSMHVTNEERGSDDVEIALSPPSQIPGTYGDDNAGSALDGEPYSTTAWTGTIPADLIKKGLSIKVTYPGGERTWSNFTVGAPTDFGIVSLPFYFFGADPETTTHHDVTLTPELAGKMPESVEEEFKQRLPIASLSSQLHPARFFKSPYAVVAPRQGGSAYRIYQKEEAKDGFAVIGSTMNLIGALREMDAAVPFAVQYYGAIILEDAAGRYAGPGGGLGGGHKGAGDYSFGGIFFHEQGHAFGLPHANDAYKRGEYPYPNGGLGGSGWGYDSNVGKFLDPFYKDCNESDEQPREDQKPNRCYKQDPMQGGHGNRDDGTYYGLFSDFQNARIQRYFEGTDATDGRAFKSPDGGYSRWNPATESFVDVQLRSTEVPRVFDKDLTAVIFTISCAELKCDALGALDTSSLEATQVYPPMQYKGDSREFVDVDNLYMLDRYHHVKAWKDNRDEQTYCRGSGCDFVAQFTFSNGEVSRVIVPAGFRTWHKPTEPVEASRVDPVNHRSFTTVGVTARGQHPTRIDLMYAPFAWEGIHARVPQVLSSWTADEFETRPDPFVPEAPSDKHSMSFDLKIAVPDTADHCDIDSGSRFVRSLETALFRSVGGGKGTLPPMSRVRVSCVCTGASCPENCERWYQYPLPESSPAELGDELSTGANIPWKPQCGCEFKKFNSDTGECGAGSVHQSSLTRMTHSDGVYYFVNEKGEGMMVRQSEKITDGHALVLDKDLDGTIAECRSRSDCAAAQFEVNHARNKTELMSAQCMSPCYFKDYWGRVSYHVDHTNQWAEPPRSYQDVERAITVRFDVHVPSDAAAREVHRIIADADGKTVTANMARRLKIDSQFTRSVPWAIDSQSLVPGSMTPLEEVHPETAHAFVQENPTIEEVEEFQEEERSAIMEGYFEKEEATQHTGEVLTDVPMTRMEETAMADTPSESESIVATTVPDLEPELLPKPAPGPAPGPARGPTPEPTPELLPEPTPNNTGDENADVNPEAAMDLEMTRILDEADAVDEFEEVQRELSILVPTPLPTPEPRDHPEIRTLNPPEATATATATDETGNESIPVDAEASDRKLERMLDPVDPIEVLEETEHERDAPKPTGVTSGTEEDEETRPMTKSEAKAHAPRAKKKAKANADADVAVKARRDRRREAKERRDERVRQVAMTEARARIAAIDAGHRAAVEILSRLGFFPDESPSLGAKPASRTAAVTGDIDYGDDDDLEESARENHVEPKDDRPRVHASLGSESLAQRRADRRSQRRAGRRHAHLMGAQAARDAVERFYGADSEEARTVAAPYSTEAADAAADAELGLSQDGLVDLARETGDEVGYAEGLRTANDALGTSYTVAEMRREGSRRASGPAPGPAPGPARGPAPGPAPGPARGPTPESTPELTLMLGEGNGRAFSRLGDGVGALARAGALAGAGIAAVAAAAFVATRARERREDGDDADGALRASLVGNAEDDRYGSIV